MLQLAIDPLPVEDRLLLKVGVDDEQVLLWLTRRLVKQLWPLLGQASLRLVDNPNVPETLKHEVAEMQRQAAVNELDSATPYRTERKTVWESPQLALRVELLQDDRGSPQIRFTAANGQHVDFHLDAKLQAGLVELLRTAVARTDWDLVLELKASAREPSSLH